MSENPYESPAAVEGVNRGGCFLNGLALIFAMLSLGSGMSSLRVMATDKQLWSTDRFSFALVVVFVIILPHAFFALLSAACWFRSRRLLYVALSIIALEVVVNLAVFMGIIRFFY